MGEQGAWSVGAHKRVGKKEPDNGQAVFIQAISTKGDKKKVAR